MEMQAIRVANVMEPQVITSGSGVKIKRCIGTKKLNYLDPFILFDHLETDNPDDYLIGFPNHPHRGIESVTYLVTGSIHYKDSLGNAGTVKAGDAQWMTTGRGIMHEQMPKPRDGKMSCFQLWINLPADKKMMEPRYQDAPARAIPIVRREDGVKIKVIAGPAGGIHGPITGIATDPTFLDISIPPGGSLTQFIERRHTAFAYVFRGEGSFGVTDSSEGEIVGSPRLIMFDDGDFVEIRADKRSVRFLLMSGEPLYEPVVRYKSLVMNTREQIETALRELKDGTFLK